MDLIPGKKFLSNDASGQTGAEARVEMTASRAAVFSDQLEIDAAKALGMILFAIGDLERDLALCIIWVHGGSEIDSRTKIMAKASFEQKLEKLGESVDGVFSKTSEQNKLYAAWIDQAGAIRLIRNQLAHGRWWFDPYHRQAVHIAGVPNSTDQSETRFSIDGFEMFIAKIKQLQLELHQLRKTCAL
jgi:hypothetical protein